FDQVVDRRGTNSIKYDKLKENFGREDLLPLWIADMDFKSPPEVMEVVERRARHGIFGYSFRDLNSIEAFTQWVERRYNWSISPEIVTISPGIVTALSLAIRIYSRPGDKVLIQPPVYPPFYSIIEENGRQLVTSPLQQDESGYSVDWDHFEESLSQGVKLFLISNSHNPIGKVWSREELLKIANLCLKYGVLILSDEIHGDLNLNGTPHTVIASLSKEISMSTITAMAPSKTFNVAGLLNSLIIIESPKLLKQFESEITALHLQLGNLFAHITMESLYRHGEEWLKQATDYIWGNVNYSYNRLLNELPQVTFIKPQSSFLLWLNFNGTALSHQEIERKLIEEAKVALNSGLNFGEEGRGYFRFNIGAPRAIVKEGLDRVIESFKKG
ncbi:MAG: PatB family C-S lyase, partial [Bacteroidales bacterium]